ncbi:MAG TPA: hypothetical protein VK961_25910 [Chthoniobacter sp.]|nr:hypothetical protein [Chthoniobacter sp.]
MRPFVERPHDVREDQIYRDSLLAQPPEFFRGYCQGRLPDIFERMFLVERLVQAAAAPQVFTNDIYRVQVRRDGSLVQLTIARLDGKPCKDWRHFQQIKNELVGPEFEAAELYPAESRLVDMDNEYHLWVNADPVFRFQFGYHRRHVMEKPLHYCGRAGEEIADVADAPLLSDNTAGTLA